MHVASQSGGLKILKNSPELQAEFTSESLTIEKLSSLMTQFIRDVESGTHTSKGWPNTCYGMSKLGLIALTKVQARENPSIVINACCPGEL